MKNKTQANLFRFIKLWQELQAKQKKLDLEHNNFARELRAEFPRDADILDGDEQFKTWCVINLKVTDVHAKELLSRAIAAVVFKDVEQLTSAGGFTAVRSLCMLPRHEQVTIMQSAKEQVKSINTIKRDRGHEKETIKPKPIIDAKTLAEFINKNVKDVPPPIRLILARYVKLVQERPRA